MIGGSEQLQENIWSAFFHGIEPKQSEKKRSIMSI